MIMQKIFKRTFNQCLLFFYWIWQDIGGGGTYSRGGGLLKNSQSKGDLFEGGGLIELLRYHNKKLAGYRLICLLLPAQWVINGISNASFDCKNK